MVSPRIGGFLADDFEIGIQPSYTYFSFESDHPYIEDYNSDIFVLAPYLRKYIPLNEWAGFYIQGGVGFGWGRTGKDDLAESNARSRAVIAGIAPGVTIRLGKSVGIDFQASLLEYQAQTYGMKDNYADTKSDPVEQFTVGPNLSKVSLGISFFL